MSRRLRIAINAQLPAHSGAGGTETALRVLAGVSKLEDGNEEYVFVGPAGDADWLRDCVGRRATIVPPPVRDRIAGSVKRLLSPAGAVLGSVRSLRDAFVAPSLGNSHGFFESLGAHVVHFPFQVYVRCKLPTIFNPHDLQHIHHPQFFSSQALAARELYRPACEEASVVVAGSRVVEDDLAAQFLLPRRKLQTIWWAPLPITKEAAAREARDAMTVCDSLRLPGGPFMLYPAMTWEHKNHVRLIDAVARVRDEHGLHVRVICTGHKTAFWPTIERALVSRGLQDQIHFPGLIPQEQLGALYLAARFVIVPTLYEAASAPLFESWQRRRAVTCSRVTSLPEQAGDAALLFDPLDVGQMTNAILRMWLDDALCRQLEQNGADRLRHFSWERTARSYRALYRKVAGKVLNEEDCDLLANGASLSPPG
jgi:glycosyltransferase involved in cell wall biosynthesis